MRLFNTHKFDSGYVLPDHFSMIINGSSGVGKTTFVQSLIKYNRMKTPENILYLHPNVNVETPVNWHKKFPETAVTYDLGLPDESVWANMKPGTLGKR